MEEEDGGCSFEVSVVGGGNLRAGDKRLGSRGTGEQRGWGEKGVGKIGGGKLSIQGSCGSEPVSTAILPQHAETCPSLSLL